jgi:hypothetical protein
MSLIKHPKIGVNWRPVGERIFLRRLVSLPPMSQGGLIGDSSPCQNLKQKRERVQLLVLLVSEASFQDNLEPS